MQLKHKKKGVSLVELILSIAVLSILSVYVFQMFITSKTLNQKAEALDYSVLISQTIFETVEKDKSLDAIYNSPLFKFASTSKTDDKSLTVLYFDENWEPIPKGDDQVYTLTFTAEKIQALDYGVVDYRIIVQRDENLELEQIYEIEMQKYY